MTLPSSGPLSIGDIAGEFGGGGGPINLNNYYAGGPHVPSGTSGVNGPVPSSGPLSMSAFYGTAAYGPFTAASAGASGSSSSGTGPPQTIHVVQDQDCDPIHVASGGPTSGSFSYAWTVDSADSGVTMSNLTTSSPHAHYDFFVGPQDAATKQATMHCLMTDTVSGLSYTLAGVQMSYTFNNNTG